MIDWNNYREGDIVKLEISNDNIHNNLKVEIVEFEWAPNRTLHLTDVKILETSNELDYPIGGIIRLPMIVKDQEFKFLIKVKSKLIIEEKIKSGYFNLINC